METEIITLNSGHTFALNLSIEERKIVAASRNYKIIKILDDKTLIKGLIDIINKAYYESGQSPKGNNDKEQAESISMFAITLLADIKEYFPTLTLAEIDAAVNRGIRKEYGEYFGINIVSIHQFIRGYKHSDERESSLQKQKIHETAQREKDIEPPFEIDMNQYMNEECIKALELYRSKGILVDFGNCKYYHLENKGLINYSIAEKKEIYDQAVWQENNESSQLMNPSIQDLVKRLADDTLTRDELIKSTARTIALRKYFDDLINRKSNLKELLSHE
jgi:hypothetical protein